jgi:hypothetical protein
MVQKKNAIQNFYDLRYGSKKIKKPTCTCWKEQKSESHVQYSTVVASFIPGTDWKLNRCQFYRNGF